MKRLLPMFLITIILTGCYSDGKTYDDGHSEGYDEGYREGYEAGLEHGYENFVEDISVNFDPLEVYPIETLIEELESEGYTVTK